MATAQVGEQVAESKTLFNALVKFWFVGIQIYQTGCGFPDELKKT